MRIGLIADVHADLPGLYCALALFERLGVDRVICAGDVVEKGPHGDAVVRALRTASIPTVRGNHDHDAIGNQAWLRENADLDHPALRGYLLKGETLEYLRGLPHPLRFEWEGVSVLLAHGTPWSEFIYLFPTSRRELFERVAREAGSDVVVLGHTHLPLRARVNGTWIVNPGSVCGAYSSGSRTCGVLTLPACEFEVFDLRSGRPVSRVPSVR